MQPHIDRAHALATLQALVRRDTQTQTAQESAAVEWIADELDQLGLEVTVVPAEGGRLNAVGVWRGTGKGASLMFNGHVDTNPVTTGWSHDPWGGDVDQTYIYGLGVSNMKAGCAAYLEATRALRTAGWQPEGDLILTFVVGELQQGVGTRAVLDAGFRADHFINCEPTDLTAMCTHAGVVDFAVRLTGDTRHLSKRQEAGDALAAAARLVPLLNATTFDGALDDDAASTNRTHVGVLRSGLGTSMSTSRPPQVADVAELLGSARFGPGQTAADAIATVRDVVAKTIIEEPAVTAAVEELGDGGPSMDKPFQVLRDAPVVQAVNGAYVDLRGVDQPTGAIAPYCFYGSDASLLQHIGGMSGVVCGPGGEFNTMPDERVAIADYLDAVTLYAAATVKLCGS